MQSGTTLLNVVQNLAQRVKLKFESRAVEDIIKALDNFKCLKPSAKLHVFPDGISKWCIALEGTIPINYKEAVYHIPISLFLLDNHPYSGPFCYVCPTDTMRIRVSEMVDEKGRIYLPYLTEWRFPAYNTDGLLQVMTMAFQKKTPLYSLKNKTITPTTTTSQTYPKLSHLPYPTGPSPIITPNLQNSYTNMQNNYKPCYPSYPNFSSVPSANSLTSNETGSFSVNPNVNDKSNMYSSNTIQPNHIRASLLSAIQDKIRNYLKEKIGDPFAELQSIDVNLQELRAGQQKLREILEQIEVDQTKLDTVVATYEEKKLELERTLEIYNKNDKTASEENKIDNAIDATTPLHRQIFRCYVQDVAIDDTIYFLGQGLKKGAINLQMYLKYVRQLSRKQFIHRATLLKCRQTANLPV